MDLYSAERLVAYKQAELRAEAEQAALDMARVREVMEHLLSSSAIRTMKRLMRRSATQVWNGSVRRAAALRRAFT